MSKVTLNYLILSLFILLSSTVGGLAITRKLEDWGAAQNYLLYSLPVAFCVFLSQCIVFHKAKNRLLYQIIFWGLINLTMTWMMLSLFFPIFWISFLEIKYKIIMASFFLFITGANLMHGWRATIKQWLAIGQALFKTEIDKKKQEVDWDTIVRKMGISNGLFIPCVPKKWNSAVSIILIFLMIVGLNLRAIYPIFSVFAWGIPATVVSSFFFQMVSYYFAQASIIKKIETSKKIILRSVGK